MMLHRFWIGGVYLGQLPDMCSHRRSFKFCPGANSEPFVTLEMKLRPVESVGDDLRNTISSPNQVWAGDTGKTSERKLSGTPST